MNVICIEEKAFEELITKVYQQVKQLYDTDNKNKWISTEETMKRLHITSKTTLQKYRDEGRIRYTELSPRSILYDVDSIDEYLDNNACECF